MTSAACIVIGPHNVPASVDPEGGGRLTVGKVNRRKLAIAQQEAVPAVILKTTWLESTVIAHDVATRVDASFDPTRRSVNSTREVNCREMVFT